MTGRPARLLAKEGLRLANKALEIRPEQRVELPPTTLL